MKKALLFLFLIVLVTGVCGCMKFEIDGSSKENLINSMVQYMNEKYSDDNFEYKGPFGGGAGTNTKTIIVSSANFPNDDIYVRQNFGADNAYTDNYLGVKYATLTKTSLEKIFDNITPYDYVLFYEVDRFACPNETGTMDFSDYVASNESCIRVTIVVNGIVLNKDSFENSLKDKLIDAGICCSATIYFDNGSGAFDNVKTEGLSGYTFKKLYNDVFTFEMNGDMEFSSSRWGD